MENFDPKDYKPKKQLAFLSCMACDFWAGEPYCTCQLNNEQKQQITQEHGDCAINGYIYQRKPT